MCRVARCAQCWRVGAKKLNTTISYEWKISTCGTRNPKSLSSVLRIQCCDTWLTNISQNSD